MSHRVYTSLLFSVFLGVLLGFLIVGFFGTPEAERQEQEEFPLDSPATNWSMSRVDGSLPETIFTVSSDGVVWVNPKYGQDEATKAFWDHVIASFPDVCGDRR